ncbi:MAG: hypothetical protein PHX83_00800 [Acidobacteriia bacterium]|nr:hypothetical protein [Terriglobia bacterium]
MQRIKVRLYFTVILMLMFLAFPASLAAAKKDKNKANENAANLPEVIWQDPGDVATLNLLYGAGGKEHAPDPDGKYTFVKEDRQGTSPKFDVTDEQGVQWKVKLGQEPQSETAATRLLWAAGYFVDEDYYLAELKVTGMPKLHRGSNFVSADGTVHRARLERKLKEVKKLGNWGWFDNPFLNKQELNGLRVMMSLLNNWDLKTINNSIYEVNGERRYLVSDAGTAFGNTGGVASRSKSNPKGYANSKFVEKAEPDYVDFVQNGKMKEVTKHIPRADAKWLGQRLSQLSEEQIQDCFRAAGYTPEEIAVYTQAVRKRIAELTAL